MTFTQEAFETLKAYPRFFKWPSWIPGAGWGLVVDRDVPPERHKYSASTVLGEYTHPASSVKLTQTEYLKR